jgi:hypothetical protein
MSLSRHKAKDPVFRQCPGCSYDFITGEGTKSCSWFECPYLPEELKVFCPQCNYNFATGEGWRDCTDDEPCDWAVEAPSHVEMANRVLPSRT